jgi:hypothetical protein
MRARSGANDDRGVTAIDDHAPVRLTRRGSLLLLDHCARLERLTGASRRSARERLEAELGPDLAKRLLGSLCGDGSSGPAAGPAV